MPSWKRTLFQNIGYKVLLKQRSDVQLIDGFCAIRNFLRSNYRYDASGESPCIFQKYSETLHDVVLQVCVFTSCKKSSIRKCSKMDWGVILEENCNFWPPKKWVLNSDYHQTYFSAPKNLMAKKRLGENRIDFQSWSIGVLEGHEITEPISSKCKVMGLLFLFKTQMGNQPSLQLRILFHAKTYQYFQIDLRVRAS